MSRDNVRKTHGLYVNAELFESFTVYASMQAPLKACEVWEKALAEYMINHPIDMINLTIQQRIISTLPTKREEMRMKTISCKLGVFMDLIDKIKKNGGDSSTLKEKLLTWTVKGSEIKNSSKEFLALLEKALKYVQN